MSLVAYGASDDSEESDTETQREEDPRDIPISDDEEEIHTLKNFPTKNQTSTSTSMFAKSPLDSESGKQGYQDSPSLPHRTEEFIIEETELEQEVRQKPSELADAPKPPPKRTKQPVKITIPSLNDLSDEEDGGTKQKPAASSVRSGLFSLLPAPIHSAKKEINRPLIPHSLGKKVSSAKPPSVQAKSISSSSNGNSNQDIKSVRSDGSNNKTSAVQNFIGYGSDSDDDDNGDSSETNSFQNFFSLDSSKQSADSKSTCSKESVTVVGEKVKDDGDSSEGKTVAAAVPEEDEVVAPVEPGLTNNSPLTFSNAAQFSSWASASSNYLEGLKPLSHQDLASSSHHYSSYLPQETSAQYNMAGLDNTEYANQVTDADDDLQHVLNDKEFQKLNGKRKRGMDEAINFVDAKVDDYVDPSELSKYMTEETEYAPKKNKDDMPTGQQKRKKQITYLAFQAKEKELELKNTWAQNKLTRRQTQAKYGF